MTTGFSLLTTATMLIHSVVGCCWHSGHEHAALMPAAVVDNIESVRTSCCGHDHTTGSRHHSDDDHRQSDNCPCDPHECSEHSCVSVFGQFVSVDRLRAATLFWSTCVAHSETIASGEATTTNAELGFNGPPVPNAAHRCALAQTWQI